LGAWLRAACISLALSPPDFSITFFDGWKQHRIDAAPPLRKGLHCAPMNALRTRALVSPLRNTVQRKMGDFPRCFVFNTFTRARRRLYRQPPSVEDFPS